MEKDTETNTGWWVEKPERADRPSSFAALKHQPAPTLANDGVWVKACVVIGTVVMLIWGAKTLMGW